MGLLLILVSTIVLVLWKVSSGELMAQVGDELKAVAVRTFIFSLFSASVWIVAFVFRHWALH